MTDTQVHALTLLVLRLTTVGFLASVIYRLLLTFKTTSTKYNGTRMIIITLVGLTFIGNFLPILIDVSALSGKSYAGALLVPYAYSNALTALTTAVGWWMLYKSTLIERANTKTEHDKLAADNKALTKDNKSLRR